MYLACECVLSYCPCAGSRESEAPSGEFLLGTLNMEFYLGGITRGVLLREYYSGSATRGMLPRKYTSIWGLEQLDILTWGWVILSEYGSLRLQDDTQAGGKGVPHPLREFLVCQKVSLRECTNLLDHLRFCIDDKLRCMADSTRLEDSPESVLSRK